MGGRGDVAIYHIVGRRDWGDPGSTVPGAEGDDERIERAGPGPGGPELVCVPYEDRAWPRSTPPPTWW